jgi:alpha-D-ribose 1-methylphosphonate 5-triphosphate synthase subunit PhnL
MNACDAPVPTLRVRGLSKHFTLHHRQDVRLPVFEAVELTAHPGEAVALTGRSGCGKSTLMRCLYGNYLPSAGRVEVRHRGAWLDLASADPRDVVLARRDSIGYVSQFLRVIPRVPTLDLVAEPLRRRGAGPGAAREQAAHWLARLNLPQPLWGLPPATFSGGEQQRVNLARGMIVPRPLLLLDEPTASLDAANRQVVIDLILEARAGGSTIVGIFHDAQVREAVVTRTLDMERHHPACVFGATAHD